MSKYLSTREFDIMCILWNADKALTSSEIIAQDESLKTVTVQTCMKKLLDHNYVKIADIVQVSKSFARAFTPIITAEEYLEMLYLSRLNTEQKITFSRHLLRALLTDSGDKNTIIDDLITFLEEERNQQ